MPFVVLLHGRGSSARKHQNERQQQQKHAIEEFLEGRSSSSRDSVSSSSSGSFSSPSSSASSSPSPSPNTSRNRKTPFASITNSTSLCLNGLALSTSTSSTASSLDSDTESSDDEPNICGLKRHLIHHGRKLQNQSLRSTSANVRFENLPSLSEFRSHSPTSSVTSRRSQHLCMWKIHPTVFKISPEYIATLNEDSKTDQGQQEEVLWPDELVLNPNTFEVWLNGKKYAKPRFSLHHLHRDSLENVAAFIGEIHLTLPVKVSGEVKLVRLVAPFLCKFNIWSQISSRVMSRRALANFQQMMGLRIGHWKLQIEYSN